MEIKAVMKSCPAFLQKWGGSMRRSLLIVRANLRRSKAQTAAILVLLLAASAMLNLWLILAMDYKSNFDRCHDRLNAGHVTLVVNGEANELRDYVREMIEEDERPNIIWTTRYPWWVHFPIMRGKSIRNL